jgi:hypothetical protein
MYYMAYFCEYRFTRLQRTHDNGHAAPFPSISPLLQGFTVLGENLPQYHFVHHKVHVIWSGIEFGPPRWEDGD